MVSFTAFAASVSIFLIIGGLLMLGVVVVLVVLRAALPAASATPPTDRDHPERAMRPTPSVPTSPRPKAVAVPLLHGDVERGKRAVRSLRPKGVDDIMEAFVRARRGEARILANHPDRIHLRVYGCAECSQRAAGRTGCGQAAGIFDAAFSRLLGSADVRETRCRRTGSPACEFEVRPT